MQFDAAIAAIAAIAVIAAIAAIAAIFGFLLSERTSGVSPVISYSLDNLAIVCCLGERESAGQRLHSSPGQPHVWLCRPLM